MIRYKTIPQFARESGYTDHAIRGKIRDGIWLEGRVWKRAPDGRILIDIDGYHEWVENGNGLACIRPKAKGSKSPAPYTASDCAVAPVASPPPLR